MTMRKFEIKDLNGAILFETEAATLKEAVERAVKNGVSLRNADLRNADLRRAHLYGAHLNGADLGRAHLYGAHLNGANLGGANLSEAHLSRAHLRGADLGGAYLYGANLSEANLSEAHLSRAHLRGANLYGAYLTRETFKEFCEDVVPALLRAGGKDLSQAEVHAAWSCRSWDNCPIHLAFDAKQLSDIPAPHRARARQFITLFDLGIIPEPKGFREE